MKFNFLKNIFHYIIIDLLSNYRKILSDKIINIINNLNNLFKVQLIFKKNFSLQKSSTQIAFIFYVPVYDLYGEIMKSVDEIVSRGFVNPN